MRVKLSREPEEKVALESEVGAMPEKPTGTQALGSSWLQGFHLPSVYHAAIFIFLEFFSWGLLTTPVLTVLLETFPQHTLLMNGLIQGVQSLLSFPSARLIGALSDVWGRKPFLLFTVFFTCFPIPLMRISPCQALWQAPVLPDM
ncbi:hippocampus abundant transcript-like protein 2 [Otolemur garnettii]|uniref:hippocampus abundant transcript-like protein 2 n=1 Tax=Otolemur garnettii TaxID=30611 RepID=UPI000C7EE407|nr:hippocampus abundant transcript-like protein 2 [Otolemur garnettii]